MCPQGIIVIKNDFNGLPILLMQHSNRQTENGCNAFDASAVILLKTHRR